MVDALGMSNQLPRIEVHRPQVPGGVPLGLIREVFRLRISRLSARGNRSRTHRVRSELDDGDEAVSAYPIALLRIRWPASRERRERADRASGEHHWNARSGVVESLVDIVIDALEAIDVAPGRLPGAEVVGQAIRGRGKALNQAWRRAARPPPSPAPPPPPPP